MIYDFELLQRSIAEVGVLTEGRNILYVYRSDAHKDAVRKRIADALVAQGTLCLPVPQPPIRQRDSQDRHQKALSNSLYSSSLLSEKPLVWTLDIDFGARRTYWLYAVEQILGSSARWDHRLFLSVEQRGASRRLWSMSEALESFVHVEEPHITRESVADVARALAGEIVEYPFGRLVNKPEFLASFEEYYEDGFPDLRTLRSDLFYRLFTEVNFDNDRFEPVRSGRFLNIPANRRLPGRLLQFLVRPTADALADVVSVLDEREFGRGRSRREVVGSLYGASASVLTDSKVSVERRTAWALLCLSNESALLKEPVCLVVDRIGRELAQGMGSHRSTSQCRWGALARAVSSGKAEGADLSHARDHLLNALELLLDDVEESLLTPTQLRTWRDRGAVGAKAADNVDRTAEVPEGELANLLLRFEDLPEAVVRPEMLQPDDSHFLLLEGPKGVGKLAVARILARARRCTNLLPSGSACLECKACSDCKLPFGDPRYIEVDCRKRDLKGQIQLALHLMRTEHILGTVGTVVFENIESCKAEALDELLYVLENPEPGMSFIFTSTEPRKVRPSIRSRARRVRVAAAAPASTYAWLERLCGRQSIPFRRDGLDVVVEASAGRTRMAAEAVLNAADSGLRTVEDGLRATRSDLSAEARAVWLALLVHDGVAACDEAAKWDLDAAEKLARLQGCLADFYRCVLRSDEAPAATLPNQWTRDEAALAILVKAVGECAQRSGLPVGSWLEQAARYWGDADVDDEESLRMHLLAFATPGCPWVRSAG